MMIWSRDLTCDHLPKAIVQEYVAEEGSVAIALHRVEAGFRSCAEI